MFGGTDHDCTQVEGHGEDMMNNMIAEFEKMGEKEDFAQVVDGMMRQLLSKELMYEPMKQVQVPVPCRGSMVDTPIRPWSRSVISIRSG